MKLQEAIKCRGGLLELTWQDVKRIVEIADDMLLPFDEYPGFESEKEYYTEVLKRFKSLNNN